MTRLLFPVCAALLSTLAGLHLSTHLRQEEQRLARWGEILQHLHLLMASCGVLCCRKRSGCAPDGNHPPDTATRQLADALERAAAVLAGRADGQAVSGNQRKGHHQPNDAPAQPRRLENRLLAVENARQEVALMHEKAARKADKDARLYQTLGWIGGLCLLLILM